MGAPTPQAVSPEEAKVSKILEDSTAYYEAAYEQALRVVQDGIDHRRGRGAKPAKAGEPRTAANH